MSIYDELPADKREVLDELVIRMLEEPRARDSGVTEAELRDRLAASAAPMPPAIDADGRRPQPGQLAAAEALEGVPVVEVVDVGGLADVAAGVARRAGSPATRKTYAATYRQLVAFAGPGAAPEILTEPFVAAFRDHLEHRGLSPATVARHLSAVRELVRAVGGPGAVDALAVKSAPVSKGEPRPLTEQQATVLLAMPDRRTTRGVRDAAMLRLLVDAGVRREELVKLTVSSIEETRRHATAVRSAIATSTSWSLRIRGKRGKERLVPLTAAATSALRAWMDRRPVCSSDALFVSIPRHGGQSPDALSTTAVWKMVKKYAKAAGLPDDIAPHRLRHTFGTRHAEADARLDVLQNLLGHSDPRTTMIYARRRADAATEAIAAVEASQLPANRL